MYLSRKDAKKINYKGNIEENNNNFINEKLIELKDYFDNIFDDIILDEEQRKVILTDEDYNLVIAGAGAGKTTTLAAKVKYLVEIKNIKPEEILIISFTNKAVLELIDKINKEFKIPARICTFHKLGLDILKQNNINYKVVNSYNVINNYFNNIPFSDLKNIILYFNDYIKYRNNLITLNNIKVKNIKDLEIANFLYLNNINFSYQNNFLIFQNNKKIVINKSHNNLFVKLKEKITKQIYININSDNMLLELEKKLIKNNFYLNKRTLEEIYKNYRKTYFFDFSNFVYFCTDFIQQLKIKNINIDTFNKEKLTKRSKLFLNIIEKIYKYYEDYLNANNLIDFEDMLNKATKVVSKINYKYIIIDEYQDVSNQRFALIKKISDNNDVKITCVGDDFQAIFSFSGSSIDLFTDFEKYFGYCSKLKITNTYRNSQELINIAGRFVMRNPNQIKKQLHSCKHLSKPVIICYTKNQIEELKKILNQIDSNKKILILGRYNFLKNEILKEKDFSSFNDKIIYSKKEMDLTFLSVHSSKGLGFDEVIILNMSDDVYGFPSKIENDEVMSLLGYDNNLEEERRLFYVALTRTKNHVYLIADKDEPSCFVKEISSFLN